MNSFLEKDVFKVGNLELQSRLITGSGKFASRDLMSASLDACGTEMVTVALKRIEREEREDPILESINTDKIHLLPNTSGVRNAKEAVFVAEMAREALETNWVKLEIHPDPKYLMPDAVESLKAAEELVKKGFQVLPYIHADPVLCKQLEEVGVAGVMPLGSPIGTNLGLETRTFLRIIIEQAKVPVIVDAGLGAPSHAAEAMEMGADAVLVNTAIAASAHPVAMGQAFSLAVEAGRTAYKAKLAEQSLQAQATSPLTGFLNEL